MSEDRASAVSRGDAASVWEPPTDRLLPARTRHFIEAAIRAASPPDCADPIPDILNRMLPAVDRYPDILGDAWGTISGDGDATRRFSERLRQLKDGQGRDQHLRRPPQAWTSEEVRTLRERLLDARRTAWEGQAVIPRDHATLLLMAAVHAGNGDATLVSDNVATTLGELAAYDRLRPILTEGYAALREDRQDSAALRATLDHLDAPLGDEDLHGVPWPIDPSADGLPTGRAELDRWVVATDVLQAWRAIWDLRVLPNDLWYLIDITPDAACPGDLITITSKGFGTTPGTVRFHVPPGKGQADILAIGPSSYVDATPQTWTDTTITVVIPQSASCGICSVRIPTGTATVGGKTVDTFRDVGPILIAGTLPEIIDLRADGVAGRLVCAPGTLVDLTWYACPKDAVVTLEVTVDGTTLWTKANLPPSGSAVLPVGGTSTTTYTVTLTATTNCGATTKTLPVVVHKPAKIYLGSLEITQVTQYSGGGTTLPKTANSVPLISGKATLVRAYLVTTQDVAFNQSEISGAQVTLRGWYEAGGELPGSPLSPINKGPFTGRNLGIFNDRKDLNRTADFLIPESWMLPGPTLLLRAQVTLPQNSLDSVDTKNQEATLAGVRFHAAKPLNVVVVLVNHTGPCSPAWPNCQGTPTMADAVATLQALRRVYPTDRLNIWLPESDDRVLDFARDKGCGVCGSFGCLVDDLQDIAKGYDNDDDMVWWAAVKVGVGGLGGCGGPGSGCIGYAASRVTDEPAIWHEFGHAFGRVHTFDDGSYPAYGFGQAYSIGEYGVDTGKLSPYNAATANTHLYSPYTTADIMSYEPQPLFFSPYTYMGIMNAHFATTASGAGTSTSVPGALSTRDREERLVVCGSLWPETGEVELKPLYHMPLYPKDARPRWSRYTLALVDEHGRTLVREALRVRGDSGEEAGPDDAPAGKVRISQNIPFDPDAAALVVRDGDVELARVDRPNQRPTIGEVDLDRGADRWTLRWRSAHADGSRLLHGVAITYDDGERWRRLAIGLTQESYSFDPAKLAGGERCRLRVYVTDGFNTASADSDDFALPLQPPLVVLLSPQDGAIVSARNPVHLQVEAISPRFGSLDGEAIRWESDRQGELGTGRDVWVTLREGQHRITVTAQTGTDSVSEAALAVRSVTSPR
jgi:hypothetical protein